MAMRGQKKQSVGIKELKDHASEIIATVQRTGRAIMITKNHQAVAQITAIPTDPIERLVAAGILVPGRKSGPLGELDIKPLGIDSTPAIEAILRDREED
jgi:antitoxin (DNA-binding transcriptional repressor) of toxin-antitoxin stability system